MKQIKYLVIVTLLSLIACNNEATDVEKKQDDLKGYEELSLSEWGYDLSIMIPNTEIHGTPKVELTEGGAVKIIVGSNYGVQIEFGEGDIELLKEDLADNLVYTSEIILADSVSLIYKQDIPNSGVKTQHHFFYKANIDSFVYEITDIKEEEYKEGMIIQMLKAVKTLKKVMPQKAKPSV